MKIKGILVPVDFSEDSLRAVEYAKEFARPFKSEIVLLHVVEPVYYATPADLYATSPNLALLLAEQRHSAKTQLARLEAQLRKAKRPVRALLKTGSPAQVIADVGKRVKADLIIMSTHGRTGLAHVVLGSVAERVVRTASCPVLTVRRPGKRKKR